MYLEWVSAYGLTSHNCSNIWCWRSESLGALYVTGLIVLGKFSTALLPAPALLRPFSKGKQVFAPRPSHLHGEIHHHLCAECQVRKLRQRRHRTDPGSTSPYVVCSTSQAMGVSQEFGYLQHAWTYEVVPIVHLHFLRKTKLHTY